MGTRGDRCSIWLVGLICIEDIKVGSMEEIFKGEIKADLISDHGVFVISENMGCIGQKNWNLN